VSEQTSSYRESTAGLLTITAPWRAGWRRAVLATVMLITVGAVAGATGAAFEAMGLRAQSVDAAPSWIRILAGTVMLTSGAYLGILLSRPFLAAAKQVGLVSVTIAIVVGAPFVVGTVNALLVRQQSSMALAALVIGTWGTCFVSTLLRISVRR
jgi:hypothetical protein